MMNREDWNVSLDNSIKSEFAKYTLVGGLAFVADFSALAVLVSGLGLHYLLATFLAFLLGVWVNYLLSVRWVFPFRSVSHRGAEFTIFLFVGVITLLVSLGLMALLVDGAGLHYLLAKFLTAAFTLIANFVGRRLLLFTNWHTKMEGGNALETPPR
jgi:putative flippase GtrA